MRKCKFTSARAWVRYFRRNAETASELVRPAAVDVLPAAIRQTVAASLPAWQLGETSDGRHLRAAARQYSVAHRDPEFLEAVDLFIKEEQRHGAALGDWLDRVGIERKQRDVGDSLFRFCRYLIPNYAVWASVVVMVESMAELYYASVKRLVPCPRLEMECRRILQDEVKHIQFQCEHLAQTRRKNSILLRWALKPVEAAFYAVVCTAVWIAHGALFRHSGLSFPGFIRASIRKFIWMQHLMNSSRYDFAFAERGEVCPELKHHSCEFQNTQK